MLGVGCLGLFQVSAREELGQKVAGLGKEDAFVGSIRMRCLGAIQVRC